MKNFKHINIGIIIRERVHELNIDEQRICNFLKCTDEEIKKMYLSESLDTELILRWSKLLEYDFFRIYTQHLILFAPPSGIQISNKKKSGIPEFRKNIYTMEVINFILELITTGKKTKKEVLEEYRIPKTTLHRWVSKYNQ